MFMNHQLPSTITLNYYVTKENLPVPFLPSPVRKQINTPHSWYLCLSRIYIGRIDTDSDQYWDIQFSSLVTL